MEPTSHIAEKIPGIQALANWGDWEQDFPSVRAQAPAHMQSSNLVPRILSMSFHGFYETEQQQQTNKQTNKIEWNYRLVVTRY